MVLIIGGTYQGKLAFAKKTYGLKEEDVFTCNGGMIDFSKGCIDKIEEFVWENEDPVAYFQAHREQWKDSVLIMQDIFCGVVPLGAENRAWRLKAGQLVQYLAGEATCVSRIFCGLEQRLK